ncbi:MAG: serine/threonine protein kinase [Actinomycetota bacterium]
MTPSPAPSPHPPENQRRSRYQALRELGRNPQASRITYLAKDRSTQQLVVIKQFQFAQTTPNWAGFASYEAQITTLKQLDHPGIPRYLDSFANTKGFCLVRNYQEAVSLAEPRPLEPEQLKQLTVSILEILTHLHAQIPPLIHLNLKPENILVDADFKVYLVDFGLPSLKADGSILYNAAGTDGFMPAEQIRNQELTPATDLYSLGCTLACFLTQTPSSKIKTLWGPDGNLNLKGAIESPISYAFIEWLEKLVEVYPVQRYANASFALAALQNLEIQRRPGVIFSTDNLEFKATEYGEILAQSFTVRNTIPDTLLTGSWEVAPHPQELNRRRGYQAWIAFEPQNFEGNRVQCQVTIDTSKLLANRTYERQILLKANSEQKTHAVHLKVITSKLEPDKLPKRSLAVLFAVAVVGGLLDSVVVSDMRSPFAWIGILLGTGTGIVGGVAGAFGSIPMLSSTVGTAVLLQARLGFVSSIGFILGFIVGAASGYVVRHNLGRSLPGTLSGFRLGLYSAGGQITFLTALLGVLLGILLKVGFLNLFVLLGVVLTGMPLSILLYQQHQILENYRKSHQSLIKP